MKAGFDIIVIGGGAAGMMAAAVAGQRGRRVLIVDHAKRIGEKIRISGGGRCNFTNLNTGVDNFVSENPAFCRSVLARYTPRDFLDLLKRHRIAWHEKHRGQLFCDDSSMRIVRMLQDECARGQVQWRAPCAVRAIGRGAAPPGGEDKECFRVETDQGTFHAARLVVATGGLSIPAIGATDFGYRLARQFDLPVVAPRPGLVPLTFAQWQGFADLAGLALEVDIACGSGRNAMRFREDLLFTHRGLSGPAVLQISSYWQPGTPLTINLAPELGPRTLIGEKSGARQTLATVLHKHLPKRLAQGWLEQRGQADLAGQRIAEIPDKTLAELGASLTAWTVVPSGSEGWKKAEVTVGGVATGALAQADLMARSVPGLHFIGEVVDVTGWLGGYNFQWAWASGVAAGRAV